MATIYGTDTDNQSLHGTDGNDTIIALAGVDWMIGSTGNDFLDGGNGASDVVMYSHLDAGVFINNTASQVGPVGAYRVLKADGQQDTVVGVEAFHATQFSDHIHMGSDTYVFAEGGNDEIHVGSQVLVLPGSGNDTIYSSGRSTLDYHEGDGSALQSRGIVAIWTSATRGIVTDDGWGNSDKFFGIEAISGSAYNDVIVGNLGNDRIIGISGDDYLFGNNGMDTIGGGDGHDILYGGGGDDQLIGGSDDDSLFGGEGENTLDGGAGNDTYFVQSDVAADDRLYDAGGDADILQVLDTSERDAFRLVYDGYSLVHETMQGHRTEIALDETGAPVIEFLQWVGRDEYGTDNYTNTLRIVTDLANITGRLIAVAGTDGADTIVMPNEQAQEGEYWGEIYANAGNDIITLSSTIQYITYAGDGDDSVSGMGDMGEFVDGEAGNDSLDGGGGDDWLYGGDGDDHLNGGDGNDMLVGGGALDGGENVLIGGAGDDTLWADGADSYMQSGAGNDLIDGGSGYDQLSFVDSTSGVTVNLATGLANDGMGGADTISGVEMLRGSNYADRITGDAEDNQFRGLAGNDTIDGGGGADWVRYDRDDTRGGDLAVAVDLTSGLATDSWGDRDTLSNIENVRATDGADSVTGNLAENRLLGRGGDDTLYGGGGHDTLEGGDGDDVLAVSGTAFTLNELGSFVYGGDGNDTLISSQLSAWGSLLSPGLGHNTVIGSVETWNSGDGDDLSFDDLVDVGGVTVVQGQDGSGTSYSGDGRVVNDFEYIQWFHLTAEDDLIRFSDEAKWKGVLPGAGRDTIIGGIGVDDLFYGVDVGRGIILDVAAGRVIDPWGDTDRFSDVENFRGSHSEDYMTATGVGFSVDLDGNRGDDVIFGSAWNDTLHGGAGGDQIYGGDGDDILDDGFGYDTIDGGNGVDTLLRRYSPQTPFDDTLILDLVLGTVTSMSDPAEKPDILRNIENLRVSGDLSFSIMGSSGANLLQTAAGNDTINGGAGADTLIGGLGHDTYFTDGGDTITEYLSEGTDTVLSSVTYILGANIENLTLTGGVGINGTGNTLSNILTGNSAANSLSGGGGNDTITGGAGNDSLEGAGGNDSLVGGDGIDTASFNSATAAVRVNLALLSAQNTLGAGTDTIVTIENLIGSAFGDLLTGAGSANNIRGGTGNDSLNGAGGNDTLDGGAGNDSLAGGTHDDTYGVDSAFDVIVENAGEGTDLVQSTVSYALSANVENLTLTGGAAVNGTGNALSNLLTGNSAANSISAGEGADTVIGGLGNDSLDGAGGIDSIVGGDGDDSILGGAGDDKLFGGAGNDLIDDGTGVDTIDGGAGIDTFRRFYDGVDFNLVLAFDLAGGLAYAPANPNVAAEVFVDVENLRVSGGYRFLLSGNNADNVLESANGNDSLLGLGGNDTLNGGLGNDSMTGGEGNDTFIVDSALDVIVEKTGEGTDLVQSTVTCSLAANVENLTLTGGAAVNGIGNAMSNILTGNSAANSLSAGDGADTLYGGVGNDSMVGGAGNDVLYGGIGTNSLTGGANDDTYIVDSATDVIAENQNEGLDLVQSTVSYTLSANLENLTLTGSATINGTGNTLSNVITGNAAANFLSGGGGNDRLIGGDGHDTLEGAVGNDSLFGGDGNDSASYGRAAAAVTLNLALTVAQNTGGAGMDSVASIENLIGSAYNDVLTGDLNANNLAGGLGDDRLFGGNGNDTLDGGAGKDSLTGGEGIDAATYASAASAVTVNLSLLVAQNTGGAGTDTLAGIEDLIGSTYNDALTGTANANRIEGGNGADSITGGAGADALFGGEGDDRFVVSVASDFAASEIIDGGDGIDELRFAATTASTLTLTSNVSVERVVIGTGSAATALATATTAINVNASAAAKGMTIAGNAGANTLTGSGHNDSIEGGAGNDSLNGGVGADTLAGGLGNDTLIGGAGADVFVFNTAPNATSNKDVIVDFNSTDDNIWLAKSALTGLSSLPFGALDANAFWNAAASHDPTDRILYNQTTGALYHDADGTGAAAAVQIAQLTAGTNLTALDFFII